jgi:hypothetical protein
MMWAMMTKNDDEGRCLSSSPEQRTPQSRYT